MPGWLENVEIYAHLLVDSLAGQLRAYLVLNAVVRFVAVHQAVAESVELHCQF